MHMHLPGMYDQAQLHLQLAVIASMKSVWVMASVKAQLKVRYEMSISYTALNTDLTLCKYSCACLAVVLPLLLSCAVNLQVVYHILTVTSCRDPLLSVAFVNFAFCAKCSQQHWKGPMCSAA